MSTPTSNIQTALFAIQQKITAPAKDGVNKAFRGKEHHYTTLGKLIDHLKPFFQEHGLVAYTTYHKAEPEDTAELTVYHLESGTSISSEMTLLLENRNNWAQGSSCTYTARYLLEGLFMLSGVDDDGQAACQPPTQAAKPPMPPQNNITNHPLMGIPTPEALIDAIVQESEKNPVEKDIKGWADKIKVIDEVIGVKGWREDPIIISRYEPIRSAVDLHIQGAKTF